MNLVGLARPRLDADNAKARSNSRGERIDDIAAWRKRVGHVHQRPVEARPVAQPEPSSLELDGAFQTNAQWLAVDGERTLRRAAVRRWR